MMVNVVFPFNYDLIDAPNGIVEKLKKYQYKV